MPFGFRFAWWVIGFCVTTFKAPFNTTGNGYFAAIGGALFSMRLMRTTTLWKAMVTRMGGMGTCVRARMRTYHPHHACVGVFLLLRWLIE